MNFTSYKKLYFLCLASVELKPHTKVLKNIFHNMVLKNLYMTPKLPTYFSIDHKIRTYLMGGPKQMLWNIFCALVRPSTLEHHRQQGKCKFLSSNLNMQNSVIMFTFFRFQPQITFLGKFGPKKSKLSVYFEIWYLD